jgi:hypothetical protein
MKSTSLVPPPFLAAGFCVEADFRAASSNASSRKISETRG